MNDENWRQNVPIPPLSPTFRGHRTAEGETYRLMKQKCYNPNHRRFESFGAKGITVCERWMDKKDGFVNFVQDIMQLEHYEDWHYGIGDYRFYLNPGATEYSLENVSFIKGGLGSTGEAVDLSIIYDHPVYGKYQIIEVYNVTRADGIHKDRMCKVHFFNTGNIVESYYYHAKDGSVKDIYGKNLYHGRACIGNVNLDEHRREHRLWCNMFEMTEDGSCIYGFRQTAVCEEFSCFENFLRYLPYIPGYQEWLACENTKKYILEANLNFANAFTPYNTFFILRADKQPVRANNPWMVNHYLWTNPVTGTIYTPVEKNTEMCRVIDKKKE